MVEDILRPIYRERTSHVNTLGVLLIEKKIKRFLLRILLMRFYLL